MRMSRIFVALFAAVATSVLLTGCDDTAPYSAEWSSLGAPTGMRQVVAKATDSSGNVSSSHPLTIIVD